jgi:hypothetical protein
MWLPLQPPLCHSHCCEPSHLLSSPRAVLRYLPVFRSTLVVSAARSHFSSCLPVVRGGRLCSGVGTRQQQQHFPLLLPQYGVPLHGLASVPSVVAAGIRHQPLSSQPVALQQNRREVCCLQIFVSFQPVGFWALAFYAMRLQIWRLWTWRLLTWTVKTGSLIGGTPSLGRTCEKVRPQST